MADTTARERRAAARAARRDNANGEQPESPQSDGDEPSLDPATALRGAASAAIAAAAVGAAQALSRRRHEDSEPEPEAEPEPEPSGQEEPVAARESPEPQPAPEPVDGDARALVERAREHLRELRGVDAESVSSIARTTKSWRIGLEVVELQRIPESTDVLATYEVELEPDGTLLGFERARRYTRSEADR